MILAFAVILTLMLLAVCYFDATRFIIPNELNLAFILLYPVFIILTPEPVEWWWSLAVMAAFFAVGLLLFLGNIFGGGDVKLLIVLSLWIGWKPDLLVAFIFYTALCGGVIAVFLLIARRSLKNIKNSARLPKVLQNGQPLPYGLAIAYAFGYILWKGLLPGLAVLGKGI